MFQPALSSIGNVPIEPSFMDIGIISEVAGYPWAGSEMPRAQPCKHSMRTGERQLLCSRICMVPRPCLTLLNLAARCQSGSARVLHELNQLSRSLPRTSLRKTRESGYSFHFFWKCFSHSPPRVRGISFGIKSPFIFICQFNADLLPRFQLANVCESKNSCWVHPCVRLHSTIALGCKDNVENCSKIAS